MTERKGSTADVLTMELQRQHNFESDSSGEWLIGDEMVQVGGIELGEWLPSRVRVSADGTRFEIGARLEDVEGLLELARIKHPIVQTIDEVVNFWESSSKISAKVEDGWLFIGGDIEPTTKGLEKEFNPVNFAYEVALSAAITGRSFEEMSADEDTYADLIKHIENPQGSTGLFSYPRPEKDDSHEESKPKKSEDEWPPKIDATNLRDYPIGTKREGVGHTLIGTPGILVRNGVSKELRSPIIDAYNGRQSVDIWDSDSRYDRQAKQWNSDTTALKLPIPDDVEVYTIVDLAKLKKLQIRKDYTNGEVQEELDVEVTVNENSFEICSQDGTFTLEIRTLACTDCELPYWKFRWPSEEESKEDCDPYKEFSMHSMSVGGAKGAYECFVGEDIYCFDCVKKLEAKYIDEHPNATRSKAIQITRERLDEIGFPDVQIWDSQVWRGLHTKDGWEAFTYIEYQRGGRTIRRHTGISTIRDSGEFEPNLESRDYIDFRYKAA